MNCRKNILKILRMSMKPIDFFDDFYQKITVELELNSEYLTFTLSGVDRGDITEEDLKMEATILGYDYLKYNQFKTERDRRKFIEDGFNEFIMELSKKWGKYMRFDCYGYLNSRERQVLDKGLLYYVGARKLIESGINTDTINKDIQILKQIVSKIFY